MIFSLIFNLLLIFLILFFSGNFFGKRGAPLVACFNLVLCFIIIIYTFINFVLINDAISVLIIDFGQ